VLRSAMRKSLKGLGGFPTLTSGFILGPSGRRCGSAFSTQVLGVRSWVSGSPFDLRLETVNQAIQDSSKLIVINPTRPAQ
jgi:hypothetical protein